MTADQRGPGGRSQICISSGTLCCAAQMHHQEMRCEWVPTRSPQGYGDNLQAALDLVWIMSLSFCINMSVGATWVFHSQTVLACYPDTALSLLLAFMCFKPPAMNGSEQLFSADADANSCFLNLTSKQAGGWQPARWLRLARGGPDYFTDHHLDQPGGTGHPFQPGHLWGSQCRN